MVSDQFHSQSRPMPRTSPMTGYFSFIWSSCSRAIHCPPCAQESRFFLLNHFHRSQCRRATQLGLFSWVYWPSDTCAAVLYLSLSDHGCNWWSKPRQNLYRYKRMSGSISKAWWWTIRYYDPYRLECRLEKWSTWRYAYHPDLTDCASSKLCLDERLCYALLRQWRLQCHLLSMAYSEIGIVHHIPSRAIAWTTSFKRGKRHAIRTAGGMRSTPAINGPMPSRAEASPPHWRCVQWRAPWNESHSETTKLLVTCRASRCHTNNWRSTRCKQHAVQLTADLCQLFSTLNGCFTPLSNDVVKTAMTPFVSHFINDVRWP